MSKSLETRIAKLEAIRGITRDPLTIIICLAPKGYVTGYAWDGGEVLRKAGESEEALLARVDKEVPVNPWGGRVIREESTL